MVKPVEFPNLEPLFRPKSVAIIGASEDPTKLSSLPLKYTLDRGYEGKIYPVNPKRDTIMGLKAYPSIGEIPGDVDAAIVIVAAERVPDALRACARKGVKAAVVLAAGFAEIGGEGKKRQDEMEAISREAGLRLLGPNTNGMLNVYDKVALGFSYAHEVAVPGKLALVSQSGALISAIVPRAVQRGLGFSYFVGVGNQADLEIADYVNYILDDPNTDAIAVYAEGFKTPEKFLAVAELALAKKKPLIVLKIGRSELSAKVALGHSASLAGSAAVFDAICKQRGIIQVDDVESMISTSLVFLKCKIPEGDGIGIASTSGGANGLLADHSMHLPLRFPDVTEETKKEVAPLLDKGWELTNPFDTGVATDLAGQRLLRSEHFTKIFEVFARDRNINTIIAALTPTSQRSAEIFLEAITAAMDTVGKPTVLFSLGILRDYEAEIIAKYDMPVLLDAQRCMEAIAALTGFRKAIERHQNTASATVPETTVDVAEIKAWLKSKGSTLTEHESKELLSRYGIPITDEAVATSPEEAVRIASRIGFPVVLKIDSAQIIHKTEAGAVKVNIRSEAELISAYHQILANVKKYDPEAELRGVLIQEMVEGGRETLVGMSQDEQFGPTLVFGSGGIFAEVLQDTSLRVAPINRDDAEAMLKETKGYKTLEAFRGRPEADIAGIIDTLLRVSQLSLDLKDFIAELDINPLVVRDKGQGVKVVDALVVLKYRG